MRSSERRERRARRRPRWLGSLLLCGACVSGLAVVQPRLAERFQTLKVTSDVYALPSPEQTLVVSLGYRAAFADSLFAHVLVSSGLHFKDKRLFEYVGRYLETINALDPKFRAPYKYADTLLTLQPRAAPRSAYFQARDVLRRGMRELPHDFELWTTAGQFMAYLAPPYVGERAEQAAWRLEGARILAHACEIASGLDATQFQCVGIAGRLSQAGETAATARFLKRVLALTDDERLRAYALAYLEGYVSEQERAVAQARLEAIDSVWKADLPFITKTRLLVLGPPFDEGACAGLDSASRKECAATWKGYMLARPELEPAASE